MNEIIINRNKIKRNVFEERFIIIRDARPPRNHGNSRFISISVFPSISVFLNLCFLLICHLNPFLTVSFVFDSF